MVNGLAVYSDDLSSEPAEVKKILLIRKKQKEAGVDDPFFFKKYASHSSNFTKLKLFSKYLKIFGDRVSLVVD